jgi:hypothetical protein
MIKHNGIDDCRAAMGDDVAFSAFWEKVKALAITVDRKMEAPALAVKIACHHLPEIAAAGEDEKLFFVDRLIDLASDLVDSQHDLEQLAERVAAANIGVKSRSFISSAKQRAKKRAAEAAAAKFKEDKRTQIEHPGYYRLDSEAYDEVADVLAPEQCWFVRADRVVAVQQIPAGFVYTHDDEARFKTRAFSFGFKDISSMNATSYVERFIMPGISSKEEGFVPHSFPRSFYAGLIHSLELRRKLPEICNILTVPTPHLDDDNKIVYPIEGYDRRFNTFLVPGAPAIKMMEIQEALQIIRYIYYCFNFTSPQSRVNAMSTIFTPFLRGIIGATTRAPLALYTANRPGTGKDYCAALPAILFDGVASEDQPIQRKDAQETAKRIMSAALAGRRRMHFANCQDYPRRLGAVSRRHRRASLDSRARKQGSLSRQGQDLECDGLLALRAGRVDLPGGLSLAHARH